MDHLIDRRLIRREVKRRITVLVSVNEAYAGTVQESRVELLTPSADAESVLLVKFGVSVNVAVTELGYPRESVKRPFVITHIFVGSLFRADRVIHILVEHHAARPRYHG